jgi:pimeloyl-ACP methyl ester carboxylesterase
LLFLIQGCATPSEKFIGTATKLGLSNQWVAGSPYRHRLFINSQASRPDIINELHIYLDGDGTPWTSNRRIADDPTPRNPLILEMMAKDPAAALLLGRPCYYEPAMSPLCNESLWTSHRYGAEVVASMSTAIQRWMSSKKINHVVLIGYSGGGVLAALLASYLKKTSAVITIAANLDIEAWSRHHGYSPPSASLNPATDAHIPANIQQIHLAGLQDNNVPAEIIELFSRTQNNALYLPLPEYDHICCWLDIWPDILRMKLGQ